MEIVPVAYDSLGVRSMATFVSLKKLNIFIDPGVALAPTRYGLKPSKEELYALDVLKDEVVKFCKISQVVIVTHYHYDHHPYPEDERMYKGCFSNKKVFAKDITKDINQSGKKRGRIFEEKVKTLASSLEYADGKEVELKKVHVSFSPAVWHGDVGSKVGKVIMVYVEKGKNSFLFGSDAQSFADPKAKEWALEKNPRFLIVDGYPTIFVGWRMSQKAFEQAKRNLEEVVKEVEAKTIILEHHIVRDLEYKEKMREIFELAESLGKKIYTAAEFLGVENFFLEAWRKELVRGERKVDAKGYYSKLSELLEKSRKRAAKV